ncbi:hypothetical protein BKA65DRAFT_555479 [Rhexocercosporidium sp. MPI-PUGE-AT-0058]|nr:hypothetical protein BKA65DRAFT_555479 [Rhexocercosporidium sp. MPI-PUGE-AT-0058]
MFMMPKYRPNTHNDTLSSSTIFDIVLPTPTPTEREKRNKLLTSQPLPDMPDVFECFASDDMNVEEDILTPPIPIRRRPSLNLQPLSIPTRGPLPPLPTTPRSTRFHSTTSTPTTSTSRSSRSLGKDVPPTPSSLAPEKMTNLLTEVLNIMNTIMDQQHSVQEEDAILADLTELVVIMQEEAESLLHLAGLVEEFVDEVEISKEAAEIEHWVENLGLDEMPEVSEGSGQATETESDVVPVIIKSESESQGKSIGHGREDSFDSALGLDDDSGGPILGHVRDMSETIHEAAIVQIAQLRKSESETRRGNLVEIGRRAMERSEVTTSLPRTPRTRQMSHTPKAKYLPHRKASLGCIRLEKDNTKKGKLRKLPPPPHSPFRDSALIMSPTGSLGFKAKAKVDRGVVHSPRWI